MPSSKRTVIVFGDLVHDFHQDLCQLIQTKDNSNLAHFFARTASALHNEFTKLPQQERKYLPRFVTLVDLIDNASTAKAAPALRFALLSVYQLARFIWYFGNTSAVYPAPEKTYLLGVCTGSFAAAAVAVSRSIIELIPAAVEAVLCAFRTAFHSFKLQQDLEPPRGHRSSPDKCAALVHSEESRAWNAVLDYTKDKDLPSRYRPFISAVTPSHVTISGPTPYLAGLLARMSASSSLLPIETPFHAAHLFDHEDVELVLGNRQAEGLNSYRLRATMVSPASGSLVKDGSFGDLLRGAVHDTLCDQLRWDKIVGTCANLIKKSPNEQMTIIPCPANSAAVLVTSINPVLGDHVVINDDLNCAVNGGEDSQPFGVSTGSKIAIVGFSGRFPDAESNEQLWNLLKSGKDTHSTIPKDRFNWEDFYDSSGTTKNTSRVKHGCFINEPGLFDARFFHLSPKEAEDADPAQRLALMATYEALEMAGYVPDRTPSTQRDRVGVFFGTTSDDWREVNSGQNVGTFFIPGGNRAFIPGRITYFFRFSGPSISVDTACSSSFAALHTACQFLWRGDCDTAIAGGTNILTHPLNFTGLDRGHFLSTTGNCNTFDDDADGYCRADAVVSLVLKRLEDAHADNDPIFGVIAGIGTNHCGQTVSITRPHQGDQLALFKTLLRETNTNPTDVSYVEMHGTGTQAGDAAEMSSVLAAMVPSGSRSSNHPLHLSSIKANIGHSESASGASALVKVLMMMQHNEIPPHIGIKSRINRNYPPDLENRHIHIALNATPWKRPDYPGGKRRSFINNFSAAGGNTAVLLEDAPEYHGSRTNPNQDPRRLYPVALSAKSAKSLMANAEALLDYLRRNSSLSLSELSYTTTARRMHHKFRFLHVSGALKSVGAALEKQLKSSKPISGIPTRQKIPSLVFTFTGQGALYAGLGVQLFENISSFRQDMVHFDKLARQHGFPTFLPVVMSRDAQIRPDEVSVVAGHLALVCTQMGLHRLWLSWGISPDLAIGHSLGEYPALFAAGVLCASDVIFLVGIWAQLLSRSCIPGSHSMIAIKAPLAALESIIATASCEIACINSPSNTVLSGPAPKVTKLADSVRENGIECVPLNIPYAFHSIQVDSWIKEFELEARKVPFHPPMIPYVSPYLAKVVLVGDIGTLNGAYLARASRGKVDFVGALRAIGRTGSMFSDPYWLEIGSHPACSTFIKQTLGSASITLPTLKQGKNPWESVLFALQTLYLAGFEVDWNEYHRDSSAAHRVVALPTYKWDLKNYWIQFQGNTFAGAPSKTPKVAEAQAPVYLSSSVHHVLEETHESEISSLTTESDFHAECLRPVLQGHKVDGVALCPSSLYADMAFTAARYLIREKSPPVHDVGLDCANMKITGPFIASPEKQIPMMRLTATAKWALNEIVVSFFSVNSDSQEVTDHALCTVKLTSSPSSVWTEEWRRLEHLIHGRLEWLKSGVDNGRSHKLQRGLVYKLFGSLVQYSSDYQGMQEVVLDAGEFEAFAEVSFQVNENGFQWNPCWIDSLGHIAGFIMNGNEHVDSNEYVFINHGWASMRCARKIQQDKTYHTYNKMYPEDSRGISYSGNTYILEDGIIIAIFEGIKFQRVPRSYLKQLLHLTTSPASRVAIGHGRPEKSGLDPKPHSPTPEKTLPSPLPKPLHLSENDVVTQVKAIICQEAGVPVEEIDLDTPFSDYGIDSLLSLTLSSRLQDGAQLHLPSSAFIEFVTLRELARHFSLPAPETASLSDSPRLGNEHDNDTEDDTDATSPGDPDPEILATLRGAIAAEAQIPEEDLELTADFSDFGLDFPLSHNVLNTLRNRGIPISMNLLAECHTLQEMARVLSRAGNKVRAAEPPIVVMPGDDFPHATSVRLQGSSHAYRRVLFLFPDGAGTATSYSSLPAMSPEILVYGLNCPWLRTPEEMHCELPQYVSKLVAEVRRRQPVSPYYLGGWSAGGILAYEAARQLMDGAETVKKLFLLDSPDPIGIQSPPERMYDYLESLGLFAKDGRKPPRWLRPHFTVFIAMLDRYRPQPFPMDKAPTTHLIYARDGLCKSPGDRRPEERHDDSREMRWLINNRTDFGGGGWMTLLGIRNLHVDVVDNANHFTMLTNASSARVVAGMVADYVKHE